MCSMHNVCVCVFDISLVLPCKPYFKKKKIQVSRTGSVQSLSLKKKARQTNKGGYFVSNS